ncbi:nascent polypeptide-associated complex subunit alpha [Pancytospora epiphaga]|nr:nascent polypeptide-associated complex subunit alpha [Pancytospora epiphaga]
MARALTTKEQSVMNKFSKFKLETIDADPVSFNSKGTMFNIKEPVVVKVGDTGALLVFGDLQKSMGLEELKAWIESKMKTESKKETEVEIDGEEEEEEHQCGGACEHEHVQTETTVTEVASEEEPRVSEEDIKIIMEQTSVTREKVVETLKKCDYDVVNAMVMLSKDE